MGEWQQGLFGCFSDIGTCLIVYFVPCVTAGQIIEAAGITSCFLGAISYLLPVFNPICVMMAYNKIREDRGIDGSVLGDVCRVFFCPCCALIQAGSEVQMKPGDFLNRA